MMDLVFLSGKYIKGVLPDAFRYCWFESFRVIIGQVKKTKLALVITLKQDWKCTYSMTLRHIRSLAFCSLADDHIV